MMRTLVLGLCSLAALTAQPQSQPPVRAVWADEVEPWRPAPAPAVWADEIEIEIDEDHSSTPVIEKIPIDSNLHAERRQTAAAAEDLKNETRQLEAIAFPVGIAIGAIGAAIIPSLFPGSTTTTTTQSSAAAVLGGDTGGNFVTINSAAADSSSTAAPATTTYTPRTTLSDFPNCGLKGSSNRVVGGTEVVENEYPWLCSLKYRNNHICGITLLSGPPYDIILVGAAHCYSVGDDPSRYTVTCGEHSLQRTDKNEVTLQVTEVVIHPRYVEASSSGFDIAVYKVNDAPLDHKMVEKKLWPACLPDIDADFSGRTSYVAGWGITQTKFIRGSKIQVKGIPDIARHTSVKVTACRDNDNYDYPRGLICAAERGQDSCQGDSGGPLIAQAAKYSDSLNKRYSWIGIVSFGVGCAEEGYPGAYTRASCYLGWVADTFGLKADFSLAGGHGSWSTDCPAGASRRASAVHRDRDRTTNRKNNKKNKNKKKIKNKIRSRSENSTYIDKSKLITIHSLEKGDEAAREKSNKSKKKHLRDNNDGNEEDGLLSLLLEIVKPLIK